MSDAANAVNAAIDYSFSIFPFVASILKSGRSSRIISLMRSSLGFLGRSMLNPLLNLVNTLIANVLYKRICVLVVIHS